MSNRVAKLALVLNLGLAAALAATWVRLAVHDAFWAADFTGFHTGWAMVLDGQAERLYDLDLQRAYQARLAPELAATGCMLPFNYPPHFAVPAAMIAFLPLRTAFYAWTLFQLVLLFPLFRFLRRLMPEQSSTEGLLPLATVAAFPPLFLSFQMGQLSLFVLVCLLGFIVSLERNETFATAVWVVLLTLKPQYFLVPAAILFAGRRWRELGWSAVLFAVWGLLASLVLGWSCWSAFLNVLRHLAWQFGSDYVQPLAMYNLKGLLTSLLGVGEANRINLICTASVLLVLAMVLWLWRKPGALQTAAWDLRLALSLQLALIVNPHFNPADVVTLIAPALLFYRGLRRAGRPARTLAFVLVCAPLLFALDCYVVSIARPSALHLFFLLMVGLALGMVAMLTSQQRLAHSIRQLRHVAP
jgi:hypothetical protein